jgi:hypothetical protein
MSWSLLSGTTYRGLGTNLKFYLDVSGTYYDITPLEVTTAAGDVTFAAANGDATITVTDTAHTRAVGDYVTFSGAASLGGLITAAVLNHEYSVATYVDADNYTVEATDTFGGSTVTANASDTGNGGASVVGAYQIHVSDEIVTPATGWGAGAYGSGTWGVGGSSGVNLRVWNEANFGEDLIAGPNRGEIYYWTASSGTGTRMTLLSDEVGASDVPTEHNLLMVSDISRFVFVFGSNIIGTTTFDPMLIRWSDQEAAAVWTPLATNKAGSLRLSHGSGIVAWVQARQEILVWTDEALYSLQYLGSPDGWGAQLLGDNITLTSSKCVAYLNDVAYWMGKDNFYVYSGQSRLLTCNIRRYIFDDFNTEQELQVFSGTNQGFNEIWWFYCSKGSTVVDKYAIYNYSEDIWYYGSMGRTAWLDAADGALPIAATYSNNMVFHEFGLDDNEGLTEVALEPFVQSSEFDIDDGDKYMFIWRALPEGYNNPTSEGGTNTANVSRSASSPVEEFTDQINLRIRARQISIKVSSDDLGVQWQAGNMRLDMRPDGKAS